MNCSVGSAPRKLRSLPSPVRAKGTGRVQKASTSQVLLLQNAFTPSKVLRSLDHSADPSSRWLPKSISCLPTRVQNSPPRPSSQSFTSMNRSTKSARLSSLVRGGKRLKEIVESISST